jgi:hypothetical protein
MVRAYTECVKHFLGHIGPIIANWFLIFVSKPNVVTEATYKALVTTIDIFQSIFCSGILILQIVENIFSDSDKAGDVIYSFSKQCGLQMGIISPIEDAVEQMVKCLPALCSGQSRHLETWYAALRVHTKCQRTYKMVRSVA